MRMTIEQMDLMTKKKNEIKQNGESEMMLMMKL